MDVSIEHDVIDLDAAKYILTDGFFDAGMLLQALKASQKEKERPSDKAVGNARRAIGKKLRLNEY